MKKGSSLLVLMVMLCSLVIRLNAQTVDIQKDPNGNTRSARFTNNNSKNLADANTFLRTFLSIQPNDGYTEIKNITDKLGLTHKTFQQTYKGVVVNGGSYMVHGKNGSIESVNGKYLTIGELSVQPKLTSAEATSKAIQLIGAKLYGWEDPVLRTLVESQQTANKFNLFPSPRLVITRDPRNLKQEAYQLAYQITIFTSRPLDNIEIIIDAKTGELISRRSRIKTTNTPITAQTSYSGTRTLTGDDVSGTISLRESRSGVQVNTLNVSGGSNIGAATDFSNNSTNFTSGSWSNFGTDQNALDAHFAVESVLDYWLGVHGRSSIDGSGMTVNSYVHYDDGSANFPNNAQWIPGVNVMVYGDGDGVSFKSLTTLDVVAHELGHGIIQFTCDVANGATGADEAFALDEGLSDIWGAVIEANTDPSKSRWLMGEEITLGGPTSVRNMQNPKDINAVSQNPDTYHGTNWDYGGEGHTNSMVLSHMFFLLVSGGTGTNDLSNSYSVVGINMSDAAAIVYRACTTYIINNDDYAGIRFSMISAAQDLFGSGSCEEISVRNAFYAVGVGTGYSPVSLVISGAAAICSAETYTLNVPANGTVSWSVTPSGIVSTSTSGNAYILTKSTDGPIEITATAACNSIAIGSTNKKVAVGNAVIGTYAVSSSYGSSSGSFIYGGASFFTRNSTSCLWNLTIDASLSLSSISWTPSGTYNLFYPSSYSASLYMTTPSTAWSGNNASTNITASGPCGTVNKTLNWQVVATGNSFRLMASPNPSKGNLNISITEEPDTENYSQEQLRDIYERTKTNQQKSTRFYLYNFNTNTLYKQWKYDESDNMKYALKTTGLPQGVYILKMERGLKTAITKIIVD